MDEVKNGFVGVTSNGTTYILHEAKDAMDGLRIMGDFLQNQGWGVLTDPRTYKITATRVNRIEWKIEAVYVTVKTAQIINS